MRQVENDRLRVADEDDQVATMAEWFDSRFWDPAHETPYITAEGGYIWVHGGPYDASEQLHDRFAGVVPDDVIERAVELVEQTGIYEWAPTQLTYYDRVSDVFVDERYEPTQSLEARLDRLRGLLALQGIEEALAEVRKLAYAGVIAALESFLWETMAYFVEHHEKTIVDLITQHPLFRDKTIKLGDVYQTVITLKTEVKAHLQRVIWHRAENVGPLFKYGLGVDLGFKGFEDAIQKRHDIVHRSGHDVEGQAVAITDHDVTELANQVLAFANEVDDRIARALDPEFVATPGN